MIHCVEKMRVVHCKRSKYDVLIDRSTIFGNPFRITQTQNRTNVIVDFRDWLLGIRYKDYKQSQREEILHRLSELKGKVLGCWCAPLPCHGDIYIKLLEEDGMKKFLPEEWLRELASVQPIKEEAFMPLYEKLKSGMIIKLSCKMEGGEKDEAKIS